MKRKATLFLAGLAAAVTMGATTASAAPLLLDQDNDFFYANYESLFGPDGNYKSIEAIDVGDHLFGIFEVQNIRVGGDPNHWEQGATDRISGVFSQRVEAIHLPSIIAPGNDPFDPANLTSSHITLGLPTISSFTHPGLDGVFGTADDQVASTAGLLGAGEMFALFHQTGVTTPFESNGTMADDLAKATDGTKFFTLGFSPGGDGNYETLADNTGYMYTHASFGLPLANLNGESWGGLNVVFNGTGYPTFLGLNDPSENEMGVGLLTDVILSSELEPNTLSIFHPNPTVGTSPWDIRSNDPGTIHPTPEPSTMLLLGAGILGLGAYTRKKFKK